MAQIIRTETQKDKFMPIYLDALRLDTVVDFDLYIEIGNDLILYRAADLPFTEKTRQTLLENNVDRLFVPSGERSQYQKYVEANITHIMRDETIPDQTKAGIVYDSTTLIVKDVLANPTLNENIKRSKALVETQVNYILQGKDAFHNLLKVMSFDYYTYTHSVNVCTFSVAFARHLGYDDEEFLNHLGTGTLMHDIGKTRISERILNKRTKLSPVEMEIVKKHPGWGVEIMRESNLIAEEAYHAILQHHEREDGSGYPYGLKKDDIHIFGKISGIADSFDAMTTRRVYQRELDTYPALKIMFTLPGAYDRKLLEQFALLMGPATLGPDFIR